MDANVLNNIPSKKKKKLESANQSNLNSYITVKSPICENENRLEFNEDEKIKWRLSSNLFKRKKNFVDTNRLNVEEKQVVGSVLIEIGRNSTKNVESTCNDSNCDMGSSTCKNNKSTLPLVKDENIKGKNDMESDTISPPIKMNIFQVMMKQRSEKINSTLVGSSSAIKTNKSFNGSSIHTEIGKGKKGKKRRLEDDSFDLELDYNSTKTVVAYQSKEQHEIINVDDDINDEEKKIENTLSSKVYNINDIFNEGCKHFSTENCFKINTKKETIHNYFPTNSHIQQIPSPKTFYWDLPKVLFKLKHVKEHVSIMNTKQGFPLSLTTNKVKMVNPPDFSTEIIDNYNECLENMNKRYTGFPVEKVAKILYLKNMKDKKSKDLSLNNELPKKRGRKKKVDSVLANNQESIHFIDYSREKFAMWTEKYKPESCEEIFSNTKSADKIRNWLSCWVEFETNCKTKSKTNIINYDSDFYYSDGDSNHSERLPCCGMIVKGDVGSGKTGAVYAICLELGINVLEINASSKRTGKLILQDLQEATKSHHVRKNNLIAKNNPKNMTLLLLDDVDIVFDQDEGFINAIHQLLSTSKRPVILIASNVSCDYLDKFTSQYPLVTFSRSGDNISTSNTRIWLQIMTIFEGLNLSDDFIEKLYYFCEGDVRQIISQLQFWLQNEVEDLKADQVNPAISSTKTIESVKLNSSISSYLVEMWRRSEHLINFNKAKINYVEKETNNATNSWTDLYNLFKHFDGFSMCDYLVKSEKQDVNKEPYLCLWEKPIMDSLEVKNSTHSFQSSHLSAEIIKCLIECCNRESDRTILSLNDDFYGNKLKRWQEKVIKSEKEYFNVIPITYSTHKTTYTMDYFPALREITRTELHRQSNSQKRGNRFYSYLRTMSFTPSSSSVKAASLAFK